MAPVQGMDRNAHSRKRLKPVPRPRTGVSQQAPITDPSWTPLFVPVEAVVVDVGAMLSHAVIVSRELGIPSVVSITGATKTIPDGALIEVDGNNGTVTILELP